MNNTVRDAFKPIGTGTQRHISENTPFVPDNIIATTQVDRIIYASQSRHGAGIGEGHIRFSAGLECSIPTGNIPGIYHDKGPGIPDVHSHCDVIPGRDHAMIGKCLGRRARGISVDIKSAPTTGHRAFVDNISIPGPDIDIHGVATIGSNIARVGQKEVRPTVAVIEVNRAAIGGMNGAMIGDVREVRDINIQRALCRVFGGNQAIAPIEHLKDRTIYLNRSKAAAIGPDRTIVGEPVGPERCMNRVIPSDKK